LHKQLGLTFVNKLDVKTITIYQDTDSVYVTFKPVIDSCDIKENPVDFILKLKNLKLNKYLKDNFESYAKKFNTENLQNLELEKISHSTLLVAKKKYILDLAWKDPGIYFKPQEKIKPVGIEIVQGSTPKFARKVLKELVVFFLSKKNELAYKDVVKKLKEYKSQFVLQEPDDICKTINIGDYEKYILEDKREIRMAEKCPFHIRGAGVYNHQLLNNKWKTMKGGKAGLKKRKNLEHLRISEITGK